MDYNEEQPLVIPDISIEDLTKQINDLKARLMPNPETLPMFVKDPEIVEGIKNHVTYKLCGSSVATSGLTRRYSDFFALRESLVKRWRGLYVPGMPPKKLVGNTDKELIEARCRLLNNFCRRLSKINYLFESEDVKTFKSNTNDVVKAIEKLPKRTYTEMFIAYKKLYPNYYETYDLILGKGKVGSFQTFSKKLLHTIKVFNNLIESGLSVKKDEAISNTELVKTLTDYEKYVLKEHAAPEKNIFFNKENTEIEKKIEDFNNIQNTFKDLHYWLEDDEMELEAMVETINTFDDMVKEHEKLGEKADSISKDIKNAQFGEKGLKSLFSFKSKEEIIKGLEDQKAKLEDDIKILHELIKVACFGLEWIMEDFKKEKMTNYFNYLKLFFLVYMKNTKTQESVWNTICSNENVKAILSPPVPEQ